LSPGPLPFRGFHRKENSLFFLCVLNKFRLPWEALIKAVSVDLQFETSESKANIASHSTAMDTIFNAGIACFGCKGANHALISASLETHSNDFGMIGS